MDESQRANTDIAPYAVVISCAGDGDTGGGLCVFDGKKVETIDRLSTAGLCMAEGRFLRLLRTPLCTGTGEILVYDQRGVTQYLRIDELSDSHNVAWDGHHLIVASTGKNSLLWISLNGEVVRRWRAPGEDDSWHLNDVMFHEGRLIACAFGKYPVYRGYKGHEHDRHGFIFDVESGQMLVQGLCGPHSPRYFDGYWSICDSMNSCVVQLQPDDGSERRRLKLESFTRGFAVSENYLYVGESVHRSDTCMAGTASVVILSRADWHVLGRITLPFREVADIAIVPWQMVNGLRTGFRTNLLRVAEQDQLWMFRQVGIEPVRLWAVSEPLEPRQYQVAVEADIPETFVAAKITLVDCTITNLGDAFLSCALPFPIFISYKWSLTATSPPMDHCEGIRTALPATLPPKGALSCKIEVMPPDVETELLLTITLIQESVAWFDQVYPTSGCSKVVMIKTRQKNSWAGFGSGRLPSES
jgi:acetolactate synthase-1/2/3 large subunit